MAWRRSSREIWSEFDQMIGDMQRQFSGVMQQLSGAAQQAPMFGGTGTVIDIIEHDEEIVIVADLPGADRDGISVRLLDPRTLRVTAQREETREEEELGYHVRERRCGTVSRTVSLPTDVRSEEATAAFKNGVLEIRLKKVPEAHGKEIQIGTEAGQLAAERRREEIEEEYREDRGKVKPSRYLSPREIREATQKVQIEDTGSAEEQSMAARLRRHKEQLLEEGKKRLAEQERENPSH